MSEQELRQTALEMAIRAMASHCNEKEVLKAARAFFDFLAGDEKDDD